jgi:transcriptional regulator of acetoin/glycerol metabolism
VITVDNLPPELRCFAAAELCVPRDGNVRDDREAIIGALEKTGWNKAMAARLLGISRQTMYRRLEEYGILRFGADLAGPCHIASEQVSKNC